MKITRLFYQIEKDTYDKWSAPRNHHYCLGFWKLFRKPKEGTLGWKRGY